MRYVWIVLTVFMLNACATNSETGQVLESAQSIESRAYVAGQDYAVLDQPLAAEVAPVLEFFYYGCLACYNLTDPLSKWSQSSSIPVALVPAHSDTHLVDSARMFHTFNVIGRSDLYVYGYILFKQKDSDLEGEARVNALLKEHDVDQELFWAAWGSDEVNQRLAGSYQLTQLAGVQSTPSFIVAGKYRVDIKGLDDTEQLFSLLSYLVNKD